MTAAQLAALGQNAAIWARCYVQLVDALIKEGVTEETARAEARHAASTAALWEPESGEACPLCGRQA